MVFKVLLVFLVLLVLKVHLERTETRVKWADLDRREAKETRVNSVHQVQVVSKVWLALLVQLAAMGSLDQEDNRVCLARRETKDQEDSQVFQDPSDFRACRVLLVRRERMETLDQWVHLVLLVPEVRRVPVEPMEHKVFLAVLDQWVLLVRREKPVRRVTQDHRERLVAKD